MFSSYSRRTPKRLAVLLAALLAVVLTAASTAGSGQAASTLPTLTVTLSSSGVTVTGAPSAGAINVVTSSVGNLKEPSVVLFRLNPGTSEAEAITAINTPKLDPNELSKLGSIVFDNEAPAKSIEAQTTLAAGKYLAVSIGEKGPVGQQTPFTVTDSTSPLTLPAPQAKEKAIEFGFTGPATLKVGELVGWEDGGFLVHMDIGFPVKSMAAAKKVLAGLKSGHERGLQKLVAGPPVQFQGPVSPGGYQQSVVTARPGIYVQVCFMETQDKRPHTRLGMERIIRITK